MLGFKTLKTNIYHESVQRKRLAEEQCSCVEKEGRKCGGDDCVNRALLIECPPSCKPACLNNRIRRHRWTRGLKVLNTVDKGRGLFTTEAIGEGELVIEYTGEVVNVKVYMDRERGLYRGDDHSYAMSLGGGLVIDAHRAGSMARLLNHSCVPNTLVEKWMVGGLPRMGIFAARDIQKGEELTFNYQFHPFFSFMVKSCHCGAEGCKGVIGKRVETSGLPFLARSKRRVVGDGRRPAMDIGTTVDESRSGWMLRVGGRKRRRRIIVPHLAENEIRDAVAGASFPSDNGFNFRLDWVVAEKRIGNGTTVRYLVPNISDYEPAPKRSKICVEE